jgi:hypothetical protein
LLARQSPQLGGLAANLPVPARSRPAAKTASPSDRLRPVADSDHVDQGTHRSAAASPQAFLRTWLSEVASYRLHARWDPAHLQQRTDVVRITGHHHVRRGGQERHMRIDDIGRTSPCEQLAYPLAVVFAQCFDADARQHAHEIGLPAAIAPDLANDRGTRPQRRPPLLEHPQLGTYRAVTTVNGDQRPGI